ncbi:hypothetical protein CD122_11350 [Staphylococcus rostri]|uniref:Uncharacterized protein n=1 Tax=Staphylococcus rostri TaxID=522262 RepID=A0A2K3YFM1_9STAP|nr:hypothetical protein CD122_11350 [Staphylococcus rostri]
MFLLSIIAFSILMIIAIFSLIQDLTKKNKKNETKKDLLSSILLLLATIILLIFSFVFLK